MLAGWRVFPVIARNSQFAGRDDAAAVRLIERRQCFRRHRSLRAVGLGQRRQSTFGDAYAGFNELFTGGRIVEAGCWAHVRRKFFDVHAATGSSIAKAALDRIGQLYAVEKIINGLPPERRRQRRQLQSQPIAEALAAWANQTLRQLSRKSELVQAFRYMRARWTALVRCFDDGRLALDNNPAEYTPRCVAIGRKNYLFAGSDAGGHRTAALYSLIESAKLIGLNPQHYLADVLARFCRPPGAAPERPG